MKITFNLTKKDCFNLNFYILKRFFLLYFFIVLIFLFILGIITNSFTEKILFSFVIGSIIYSIIIAFILSFILLLIVVFRILFSSRYKMGVLCEHVIEIDEEGFTESTFVNRDFRAWSSLYKIKQNKRYIFIFVGRYRTHVIPKNAFSNICDSNCFYANLITLWKTNNRNIVL